MKSDLISEIRTPAKSVKRLGSYEYPSLGLCTYVSAKIQVITSLLDNSDVTIFLLPLGRTHQVSYLCHTSGSLKQKPQGHDGGGGGGHPSHARLNVQKIHRVKIKFLMQAEIANKMQPMIRLFSIREPELTLCMLEC